VTTNILIPAANALHAFPLWFVDDRERETENSSSTHISLWEHSSHFRLIGRGVPSVSAVSQLLYKTQYKARALFERDALPVPYVRLLTNPYEATAPNPAPLPVCEQEIEPTSSFTRASHSLNKLHQAGDRNYPAELTQSCQALAVQLFTHKEALDLSPDPRSRFQFLLHLPRSGFWAQPQLCALRCHIWIACWL